MRVASAALFLLVASMTSHAAFPDVASLPSQKEFPDPLKSLAGKQITGKAEWEHERRPELKRLFQHYMYGDIPAYHGKIDAQIEHEDSGAFQGQATLREVALRVDPKAPPIRVLLVIPNQRQRPVPAFVGLSFCGNHAVVDDPKIRIPDSWMYPSQPGVKNNRATEQGRGKQADVWAIDQIIERGYAVAIAYNGDIDPDVKETRGGLSPYLKSTGARSATIATWAWGVSRIVDYLVTRPELDPKRIAVVGHSRLGKTALVAAAFDDRIALAIPHQAGCGGTAPSRKIIGPAEMLSFMGLLAGGGVPPPRGIYGESVKRINTSFPHWFNDEFKKFNADTDRLPFDQHCLVALVAPRPVLFSNAVEDTWANPSGQFEVLRAADPVYRFLGKGGLEVKTVPPVGTLSAGNLGYFIRPGAHSMTRGDWKIFLDFTDTHFKTSKIIKGAKR